MQNSTIEMRASVWVMRPSIVRSTGVAITTRLRGRLWPWNSGLMRMRLPTIASSGIISMKRMMEAPIRLPTYISGVPSMTALRPTANSLTEVNAPNTRKETAKDETLRIRDNRSTELAAKPEPIQIAVKASATMNRCIIIMTYAW